MAVLCGDDGKEEVLAKSDDESRGLRVGIKQMQLTSFNTLIGTAHVSCQTANEIAMHLFSKHVGFQPHCEKPKRIGSTLCQNTNLLGLKT